MSGDVFGVAQRPQPFGASELFSDVLSKSRLLDSSPTELFSLVKKFNKKKSNYIIDNSKNLIECKLAIFGSTTTSFITDLLEFYLFAHGIKPTIFEGVYNSVISEITNVGSDFRKFRPNLVLLMSDVRQELQHFPKIFATQDEIDQWVNERLIFFHQLWKGVGDSQIIQTLFVIPDERTLGAFECNVPFSKNVCIQRLNLALIEHRPANVVFLDLDFLAARFGKRRWGDPKNYFLNKQPFSFDALELVVFHVSCLVRSLMGRPKKCLVLDLDNTLWGGIIGDDGIAGIKLDPNDPEGEAFIAFQKYVKALKERGVLLAVCSKNDENIAKSVFFQHPAMVLQLDDIACFVANWRDKATNIHQIARILNIGMDSIVFFDDNPVEREIVRQNCQDVQVIEVPDDPSLYIAALDEACAFDWGQLSHEDTLRTASYVNDVRRKELEVSCVNYDDFLSSLGLEVQIGRITDHQITRFTQLINKSNQFNFRTIRYCEADIIMMMGDRDNHVLLYCDLNDKFSNYGLISAVILKRESNYVFVDTWVMSCRVLNRGVEKAVTNSMVEIAKKWGCDNLWVEYIPTKKNNLVSNLPVELGFRTVTDASVCPFSTTSGLLYLREIKEFRPLIHHIKITNQ
ncbi:MAG: HAD family hydrolase [Oligoflexales bacterium]|nr:HAD family hydrolase [Oligoflexales bacterium]